MRPAKLVYLAKLHFPLRRQIYAIKQAYLTRVWDGSGPAPHPVKQKTLARYAKKHGLRTLVETGTFYGDMVAAMRNDFREIFSIELREPLAIKAQRRFCRYPHISILHGDSASVLGKLVPTLGNPTLFWLDGHYSGGITAKGDAVTPSFRELSHIKGRRLHRHRMTLHAIGIRGSSPADYITQAPWDRHPSPQC